jgi:hypothetical protein
MAASRVAFSSIPHKPCGFAAARLCFKLFEETLTLQKAKLGPDHPDTLKSMNSLAISYAALGRHTDARLLFEETLALRKAELGPAFRRSSLLCAILKRLSASTRRTTTPVWGLPSSE